MEEASLKWLMGDRPVDPFRVRHRQYEEMSEKSVMSDDGRVNVEKRENGENDEGENDKNGENDEGDHKDKMPEKPCLPGCTRAKDHKMPWHMSIYHMQTYLLMKGPGGPDEDDPMLLWIAEQDKKKALKAAAEEAKEEKSGENDEEHIKEKSNEKGMLTGAKDSIKMEFDWKIQGPAKFEDEEEGDRSTSFNIPRPKIHHLAAPDLFDPDYVEEMLQKHQEAGTGWSEFVDDYCSDDENDPENGRVSPCTFLRWSESVRRYDAPGDKFKSVMEERKDYDIPDERQRPESPNTLEPRPRKHRSKEAQVDERDGSTMSPICSEYAQTQPSVLWSPPPMEASIPKGMQKHQMFRMDAELAVALREGHKEVVLGSADSFGLDDTNEEAVAAELQNVNLAEVNAVVDKYWNADKTLATMEKQQRDLALYTHHEHLVNDATERYRHAATALKHENRRLMDCAAQRRRNRDRRIMQHVDGQMRELEYEGAVRRAEVEAKRREHAQLRRAFEHEKAVQARLLAEFGKAAPDEVFAMYPDVWAPLEQRKNYRNLS